MHRAVDAHQPTPRAQGGLGAAGTTEFPAVGVAAAVVDWRDVATVEWRRSGRWHWGGADSSGCPVAVGPGRVEAAAGSREVPITLSGVTDQTRAKSCNPREAGRHAVAVGVAGDEMVCEQTRYRLVEVPGIQRQIVA